MEPTASAQPNLIVVTGPTAAGKTAFAAALSAQLDTEIISADSRQVYRRMDIGTGKDYGDYLVGDRRISCHLIDIREPGEKYSVYEFQQDFFNLFDRFRDAGRIPVLAGGTGLYIEAVLKGYRLTQVPVDEEFRRSLEEKTQEELAEMLRALKGNLHNNTDLLLRKRTLRALEIARYEQLHPGFAPETPEVRPLILGINLDRLSRRRRISERLRQRLDNGLVEEVRALLDEIGAESLLYYGLEYKYITQYLLGELDYDAMFRSLETAIHQYAKRQMTWFRKMEREGMPIHWLDGHMTMKQKLERTRVIFKKNNMDM